MPRKTAEDTESAEEKNGEYPISNKEPQNHEGQKRRISLPPLLLFPNFMILRFASSIFDIRCFFAVPPASSLQPVIAEISRPDPW
jgi:hypothetical protein